MKQLLFTFFAIVLCYSIFFDDNKVPSAVDEVNYIYEDASNTNTFTPDTLYFYSCNTTMGYCDWWINDSVPDNFVAPLKY